MLTKHFVKTLVIFMSMIIIGLIGVFLVTIFDNRDLGSDPNSDTASVNN